MIRRPALRLAALCAAGALLAACSRDGAADIGRSTSGGSEGGGQTPSTSSETPHATDADFAAVRQVLTDRARAITTGDRAAFLRTLATGDRSFVSGQLTYFDNLQALPVRSVSYDMQNYALTPADVTGGQLLRPDVSEHVFMPSTDDRPTANDVGYTFVHQGDRWLLAADSSGPSGNERAADSRPWAGGPLTVVVRGPLLVVMDRSAAQSVDGLADQVEADLRAVSTFLHVPLSTHLLVDASTTGRTSRVNQLGSGDSAAAAAITYPVPGVGGVAGWRIKINPTNVSAMLSQPGLLRHELTHFVLRRINLGDPTWLVEGVAEVAGYWPTQFDDQEVSAAYFKRLMAADRKLPQTPFWSNDPDVNYQLARGAVDYLVLTYGVDKLVRFMRSYGNQATSTTVDDHTGPLLKQVYGTTEADVVRGAFGLLAQFHH
jgi:hypothetical protein